MPNLNGTGLMGQCPLTGRRKGRCNASGANQKNQNPEQSENPNEDLPINFSGRDFNENRGRGGRGCSRGMGRQNRFRGGN
jgi:hypothetical protein